MPQPCLPSSGSHPRRRPQRGVRFACWTIFLLWTVACGIRAELAAQDPSLEPLQYWSRLEGRPAEWAVAIPEEILAWARKRSPDKPAPWLIRAVQIYRVEEGQRAQRPVLAKIQFTPDAAWLVPRFPLQPGQTFEAVVHWGETCVTGQDETERWTIPEATPDVATQVAAIYPSGDTVPENLLRCYLHFSRPMSAGLSREHVHLFAANGDEVELPFLWLDEELWDPGMTRLTLLLDPGRVKRGLKPNEDVGRPLVAGETYELVIDAQWPDAQGNPLAETFRRKWTVTPADYIQPTPEDWKVQRPAPDSRQPLEVRFAQPLDHAMALRWIQVTDAQGQRLAGEATLLPGETQWQWLPSGPWPDEPLELRVDSRLEDPCGNSPRRKFETSLDDEALPPPTEIRVPVPRSNG